MVIGTTSEVGFLESLGICDAFAVTYHVPTLKTDDAKKVIIVFLNMFASLFIYLFFSGVYRFPVLSVIEMMI